MKKRLSGGMQLAIALLAIVLAACTPLVSPYSETAYQLDLPQR